jgi:cellulose biosynthesis protein BcsQ
LEIIAVYSIKGGVGKTTTAVNLAYLSAQAGWPTLLWDLDPQGAATFMLRSQPRKKSGAKEVIGGERDLDELVRSTDYERLDILPADFSYRRMDLHLHDRRRSRERFNELMRPLHRRYGCLFLDCPPGLSLVSENVLNAADALLIPVVPSPLSTQMLHQLIDFISRKNWKDLVLLPFFSMVDRRRKLHKDIVAEIGSTFPMMLGTQIPYSSEVEQASVRRAPLPAYAPRNLMALIYAALWQEIDYHMDAVYRRKRRVAAEPARE